VRVPARRETCNKPVYTS